MDPIGTASGATGRSRTTRCSPTTRRPSGTVFGADTGNLRLARGPCRYGIWGDWEEPYLTLEPEYEAAQLRVFGAMVAAGHIYRGLKPVHWSPSSQTALAEAELEYPEGHTSRAIYVAMPLESTGESVWELPAGMCVSSRKSERDCFVRMRS